MADFRYGFILYCYTKDDRPGYIGTRVSSKEKLQGDVRFYPSQLGFKYNVSKYYLVRYSLKNDTNWVDAIEVVKTFDKKQYGGVLSVDETGEVRFERCQPAGKATLEAKDADISRFPFQQVLKYMDTDHLNAQMRSLENGIHVIEFSIPKERFIERAKLLAKDVEGEWEVGIVNFYHEGKPIYIYSHHENKDYIPLEKYGNAFICEEKEINFDWVRSIYTLNRVNFVCYQKGDQIIEDREKGHHWPKAKNVIFVERISSRAVVKLIVEDRYVRILLLADSDANIVNYVGTVAPDEEETIFEFLNRYRAVRSERCGLAEVNDMFQMIESYQDDAQTNEEEIARVRFFTLKDLYPIVLSNQTSEAIIASIDICLKYQPEDTFKLTLYKEKAYRLLLLKRFQEAEEVYQTWKELYADCCIVNGKEESQKEMKPIEQGLRICAAVREEKKDNRTGRLLIPFSCAQILNCRVDERTLAETIGACTQSKELFNDISNGNLSLSEVLEALYDRNELFQAAKCIAILGSCNTQVNDWIETYFAEASMKENPAVCALTEELAQFASDEMDRTSRSFIDSYQAAVENFNMFYRAFQQVKSVMNISTTAYNLHEFIKKAAHGKWLDHEVIDKIELGRCLKTLEDYEEKKGFYPQAQSLRTAKEQLTGMIEGMMTAPSLIAELIYQPKLSDLANKTTAAYGRLCANSKPRLSVETKHVSVEISEADEKEVTLMIPITIGANMVQSARNVTLIVDCDSEDYRCEAYEYFVISNLVSDGSKATATVPLTLTGTEDAITVRVRLKYEYLASVNFEKNGDIFSSREEMGVGYYPSEQKWFELDISTRKQKEKRRIRKRRIKYFNPNGQIGSRGVIEPGVLKILENRNSQMERVMSALTYEDENKAGKQVLCLSDAGGWIFIYGQWRVGKTVILNCIEERFKSVENALTVKISLKDGAKEQFESNLVKQIVEAIERKSYKMEGEKQEIYQNAYDDAKQACGICGDRNEILSLEVLRDFHNHFMNSINQNREADEPAVVMLLLVDEFTELYQAILRGNVDDFFVERWMSIMMDMNMPCITAGGEHAVSLVATYASDMFPKILENIYVQYLTEKDVIDYVRYIFEEAPEDQVDEEDAFIQPAVSDEAMHRIYELTQGNAFLMRLFCEKLIDYLNEYKRPQLNIHAVNATMDYIAKDERADMIEQRYFHSLYDPFGEKESDSGSRKHTTKRIADDTVRDENQRILHKIVKLADKNNHSCLVDELWSALKEENQICDKDRFDKLMTTFKKREIIDEDSDKNVKIRIDLYYELMRRCFANDCA